MGAYDPPLDPGIAREVEVLNQAGIETFESCEGSEGHAYPEPTICFNGDHAAGYRAVTVALQNGLKVSALRRAWSVIDGELVGPHWEMTFWR